MTENPDGATVKQTQVRLAIGPAGWTRGGGELDPDGLCDYVASDDGSGQVRHWAVRVPLRVEDGVLIAGAVTVEELE